MKTYITIGLFGLFLILTGCAEQSRLKMDYGTSYRLLLFNQTLNPEAEKNLEPVEGVDGRAAQATVGRYEKSFEEKPSAPVYNISVGTLGR